MAKYYVISPNADGKGKRVGHFLEIMRREKIVMLGWGPDSSLGAMFANMQIGDIVIVAQGANWQKKVFFCGEVASDSFSHKEASQCRHLNFFTELDPDKHKNLFNESCTYYSSNQPTAIYSLKDNNSADQTVMRTIKDEIQRTKNNDTMNQITDFVLANKNIILHGAPGTGKTFLAKEIARKIVFGKSEGSQLSPEEKLLEKECIKMVQFHPSYDYTDFVEGLRPDPESNENLNFVRTNGIFKEFCRHALTNYLDSKKDSDTLTLEQQIKRAYDNIVWEFREGKNVEFEQKSGVKIDLVDISTQGNLSIMSKVSQGTTHVVSWNRLCKLLPVFNSVKILNGVKNLSEEICAVIGGCNASAYWAVLKYLFDHIEKVSEKPSVSEHKYVFIIDEINRGDMSKIFGELFFSIDPGYRGPNGTINTQYQPLVDDEYSDGFYVPENVYIIGTMNDIDRSVESMDFAMRRRFAFHNVTAESTQGMLDAEGAWKDFGGKPDDAIVTTLKHKMDAINQRMIATDKAPVIGLTEDYQIGASYFLKYGLYSSQGEDVAYDSLWKNHLKGLLKEYLRGTGKEVEKLNALEEEFTGAK